MKKIDRRRILKFGSATTIWTSPVVSSIVLPVHAQTSAVSLVDATLPPPGLIFCAADPSDSVSDVNVRIQNTGNSPITITNITVTADIGSSNWTADTVLPVTLDENEILRVIYSSSPEFTCTSTRNPSFSAIYETNAGSVTIVNNF